MTATPDGSGTSAAGHRACVRYIEDFFNGTTGRADQFVTGDFVGHWPDRDVEGPGQLDAVLEAMGATYRDVDFWVVVGPLQEGDLVAGRWTTSATTADGRRVTLLSDDLVRVVGDRVADHGNVTFTLDHP